MMISRQQLIKEVAEDIGATQADTKIVLDSFEKLVISHIANQDEIKPITGIIMNGELVPGHDMYTAMLGKTVHVDDKIRAKVKIGPSFKRAINK